MKKRKLNMTQQNAIAIAVQPIKQSSIDAAVEATHEVIANIKTKLETAGWDLNVAFPRPGINASRATYMALKAAHDYARSLVSPVKCSRKPSEPFMVTWCEEGVSRAIKNAADDAAFQYEAYVVKLIKKVGACDSAVMGYMNGVWHDSNLVVIKGDAKEVWNTKCIVNRSVYGKVFNQFPTRLRK
jgi:hypothetical protein